MLDAPARLQSALSDRYRLEREIGSGGMATVYLAFDLKHEREVALKILRPELGAVLGSDRFLAEIKITARLDHPHILTLIDSGVADSFFYYVLPYVRGESLRDEAEPRASSSASTKRSRSRARSRARSTTRTATAWCTATSSPRTSSCRKGKRCSPTSASPSR